jgi:DNA-binding response OmpR family regulator
MIETDWRTYTLRMGEARFSVTRTQLAVLTVLNKYRGTWVSARTLLAEALGIHGVHDTALIRVHVHAIRRRLGGFAHCLRGSRGQGYMLVDPPVEAPLAEAV